MKRDPIDYYQNRFSSVWSQLPGYKTSWVDHLRLKAINDMTEYGFPSPRSEDWKYTDLKNLWQMPFSDGNNQFSDEDWDKIRPAIEELDVGYTLVFVNGQFIKMVGAMPDQHGIFLSSLSNAILKTPESIKNYLTDVAKTRTAFETLNTAFMQDGAFVTILPGTILQQPIQLLHVVMGNAEPAAFNNRNIFAFGKNSRTTIIERYLYLDEEAAYFNNIFNQFFLAPGAVVDHYKIQDDNHHAFHLAVNRIAQEEKSSFDSHAFAFGSRLSRNDVQVRLNGKQARCSLKGLFMVDGTRQADNYTLLEHIVPECTSDELYKGILNDEAKGVFRGKIKVEQDAQKSDASLNNANLLLSANAEVNTMPQLEIYADDVKCNHGSSSGQLDENRLFYLMSRGVDAVTAENLLIQAFANSVTDSVVSKPVRSHLGELIASKLPKSRKVKEPVL